MRVVVAGAGVGGLACAVRLAEAGHDVLVLEQGDAPGGKARRLELPGGFRFDTGPSLLTMPWVVRDLLGDDVELVRVEPVTRYRFADGSAVELSADLPRALAALEAFSPGAGADWARYLGTCASMWRASEPFLAGPPPWPPRRARASERRADPRDLVRVKPWLTLSALARATCRDPRLRMVVERFATYAGADPRRAPAALAVAGYVEHAYGAWHVRGGLYAIVEALVARLRRSGGELRLRAPVRAVRRGEVDTDSGGERAQAFVWNGDALALDRLLGRRRRRAPERSLSGLAVMLAVRGRTEKLVHHEVRFPADPHAEFDDAFSGRPVGDPTVYVSASCASDPDQAPPEGENWFVLVNAPAGTGADWEAEADRVVERLRLDDRVLGRAVRSPADLEAESGAVGGAIYGDAPHGRLAALRRPGPRVRGVPGLWRVGGTVHPGGGLPLVLLGAAAVAKAIGSTPSQVPADA